MPFLKGRHLLTDIRKGTCGTERWTYKFSLQTVLCCACGWIGEVSRTVPWFYNIHLREATQPKSLRVRLITSHYFPEASKKASWIWTENSLAVRTANTTCAPSSTCRQLRSCSHDPKYVPQLAFNFLIGRFDLSVCNNMSPVKNHRLLLSTNCKQPSCWTTAIFTGVLFTGENQLFIMTLVIIVVVSSFCDESAGMTCWNSDSSAT